MWWFSLLFGFTFIIATGVIYTLARKSIEENIVEQLSVSTGSISTMIQTATAVSIRNHLQAIAEKNLNILQGFDRQVRTETITEPDAKALSKRILLSQTIGNSGYIFALSGKGILAIHPNKEMQDHDVSDLWLAKQQLAQKEGYLEYKWKNPGEDKERLKAMYMVYFKPWDWIISVSSYREEFKSLLNIDDFKAGVESFSFGASGYSYILSGDGKIIFHPQLKGNVLDQQISRDQPFFSQMLQMKNGQLKYLWKDSENASTREKLVIFQHIPDLDWLIASTAYIDEILNPLKNLQLVLLSTLLTTLLLILPLSLFLGASITKPITLLTQKISKASEGDYSLRAEEDAPGEIGILARQFNLYMERLKNSTENLEGEINQRSRVEQQLKLFAKVFENALEGICITDAEGRIVAVNNAFSSITGYPKDTVLGKNPRILKSNRHGSEFYSEMWQGLLQNGKWVGEIWNRRANGEAYPEILSISSISNVQGEVTHFVAVFHDITEMKLKEEQIRHQAYHDALTGLPNRFLARDRLNMSINNAKRKQNRVAVFYMDLDNFKHVNDSLGHPVGDVLLQQVSKRLLSLVRAEDTVARLGGDEFQIIGANITSIDEVIDLADRLLQGFAKPFTIDLHELFATLSIGIAIYPQDGITADIIIKNADVALYQAKLNGKNNYHLFTSELSDKALYRLKLEAEFRQALLQKEFLVYYQPKIRPESGTVTGVEALVRWQKPDGTIISPNDFIPLAEETGLITQLGSLVLEHSCKALKILRDKGHAEIKMAVNLSPFQFEQANLVKNILSIVEEQRVPVSRLELEITETTMMTNLKDTVEKLKLLVDAGISVSIDDFGTGYSSLYYLKAFPIEALKIDRSFISDITIDPNDAQIVETIILMAHNLGIGVVAEGVETSEQLDLLKNFGCDLIQGYYYSPPCLL